MSALTDLSIRYNGVMTMINHEPMPRQEIEHRFKVVEDKLGDVKNDVATVREVHAKQAEDIAVIRTVAESLDNKIGDIKNTPYKLVAAIAAVGGILIAIMQAL